MLMLTVTVSALYCPLPRDGGCSPVKLSQLVPYPLIGWGQLGQLTVLLQLLSCLIKLSGNCPPVDALEKDSCFNVNIPSVVR